MTSTYTESSVLVGAMKQHLTFSQSFTQKLWVIPFLPNLTLPQNRGHTFSFHPQNQLLLFDSTSSHFILKSCTTHTLSHIYPYIYIYIYSIVSNNINSTPNRVIIISTLPCFHFASSIIHVTRLASCCCSPP